MTPRGFRPHTVTRRVGGGFRKAGKSNPAHTALTVCVGLFSYRATHRKRAISPGTRKQGQPYPLGSHPPSHAVKFFVLIVAAVLFAEAAL